MTAHFSSCWYNINNKPSICGQLLLIFLYYKCYQDEHKETFSVSEFFKSCFNTKIEPEEKALIFI